MQNDQIIIKRYCVERTALGQFGITYSIYDMWEKAIVFISDSAQEATKKWRELEAAL